MDSNNFGDTVTLLKCFETERDLNGPLKDKVQALRHQASFLKAFFSCRAKWQIDDANLKFILIQLHNRVLVADHLIHAILSDLIPISSIGDWRQCLDTFVSLALETIEFIKPSMLQVYDIISKSSRSTSLMTDEAIIKIIDSLLESVRDLLRSKADSIALMKEDIEVVGDSITFLKTFFAFTAKRCSKSKTLKDLRTHVEVQIENVSCLLCLCSVNSKTYDIFHANTAKELFGQVHKFLPILPEARKIYIKALKASKSSGQLLKARPNQRIRRKIFIRSVKASKSLKIRKICIKSLNASASSGPNIPMMDETFLDFLNSLLGDMRALSEAECHRRTKGQVLALEEELRFFKDCAIYEPPRERTTELDDKITGYLKRTTSLICDTGCAIYSFYDEEINKDAAISLLLAKAKTAKEVSREIYHLLVPKSFRSNVPRTNEMGIISTILQNLKEKLNVKADLVAPLKSSIEAVQEGLLSLQEDFSAIAKHPGNHEKLKDQLTHFEDIAYRFECVIDSFFAGGNPLWCYKLGMFNAIEEVKVIKTELKDIVAADEPKKPTTEPAVFEDQAEKIKEQLNNGLKQLQILSIVGMPGIGKTTLADSIFENPSAALTFHVRARCCVTQLYQKRRLLLEILQQLIGPIGEYIGLADEDLDQMLYQSLKGKRYLILLDDIWDIRPWEDMQSSFPDDNKGSRIIFTSRFRFESKCIITYPLDPLSDEKCWEMLQTKLFQKENCPSVLVKIGQQIANICKGLPLTVDLVAGILRTGEQKEDYWQHVAKNLTSKLVNDPQGRCRSAVDLSYHHLPDHLKPCFLYFGAFPEDTDVPTRKLIWMWIAEGFVPLQNAKKRSLEYVAETYLNDLITRSLITISKRRSLGGVKASRAHDLLREFALAKAKEHRFLGRIDGDDNSSSSSSDCYTVNGGKISKQYRSCIYGHWWQFEETKPSGPGVRSLFFCGPGCEMNSTSLNSNTFGLLRVLDLARIKIGNFPGLMSLVHLRFSAIWSDDESIVSSIQNLQILETFILERSFDEGLLVVNIRNLKRLRHFHISSPYIFQFQIGEEMDFMLDNSLQTLSRLMLLYGEETEKMMRKFPNLQKLKCCFGSIYGANNNCVKLDFLSKLESLTAVYAGSKIPCPWKFSFPIHLKKLLLSNFRLPWSEISVIGKLEHLEVLKLVSRAFEGEIWNMRDDEFSKLKLLSLSLLNIEEWNASEDHLPRLEQLMVGHCEKLKQLPSDLGYITTLQKIEIWACNPSLEKSAKNIKEDQREMGNEQFAVKLGL